MPFYVGVICLLCVLALVEFVQRLCHFECRPSVPRLVVESLAETKHGAAIFPFLEVVSSISMSSTYSRLAFDIPVIASPGGDDQQVCTTPSMQLGFARSSARLIRNRDLSGRPGISRAHGYVRGQWHGWWFWKKHNLRGTSRVRWRKIGRLRRRLVLSVGNGRGEKCDTPEQDYPCPYLSHITSRRSLCWHDKFR